MTDALILALLQERSEEAVAALSERYGPYCRSIAMSVLGDAGAAEECLNDTWFAVWRRIPPELPRSLRAFCGRITRRRAIDRLRQAGSLKRGGGELPLILEELAAVAAGGGPAESLEARELGEAINRWLGEISPERRRVFLGRYWEFLSLEELAAREGMALSRVKSILYRVRKSLKDHLRKEGLLDE